MLSIVVICGTSRGTARLHRAAELAQRLGARPLSDDITQLARRARIALGRPGEAAQAQAVPGRAGQAQVTKPVRLGLIALELQVLWLIQAGRRNRTNARERLFYVTPASV